MCEMLLTIDNDEIGNDNKTFFKNVNNKTL